MNFGKYKGVHLRDVPLSYMRWCLANLKIHDSRLRGEIEYLVRYVDNFTINTLFQSRIGKPLDPSEAVANEAC